MFNLVSSEFLSQPCDVCLFITIDITSATRVQYIRYLYKVFITRTEDRFTNIRLMFMRFVKPIAQILSAKL